MNDGIEKTCLSIFFLTGRSILIHLQLSPAKCSASIFFSRSVDKSQMCHWRDETLNKYWIDWVIRTALVICPKKVCKWWMFHIFPFECIRTDIRPMVQSYHNAYKFRISFSVLTSINSPSVSVFFPALSCVSAAAVVLFKWLSHVPEATWYAKRLRYLI